MSVDAVATSAQVGAGPARPVLDPNDPHTKLQKGVSAALQALPGEFEGEGDLLERAVVTILLDRLRARVGGFDVGLFADA